MRERGRDRERGEREREKEGGRREREGEEEKQIEPCGKTWPIL